MSANLTPQYHKAEEAYRRATSAEEELAALEAMLVEIPKHKGTEKLQSDIKQKVSKARKKAVTTRFVLRRIDYLLLLVFNVRSRRPLIPWRELVPRQAPGLS